MTITCPRSVAMLWLGAALLFGGAVATAQSTDSLQKKLPGKPDSVATAAARAGQQTNDTTRRSPAQTIVRRPITRLTPPLTPRRAFLYSLAIPGLGQARLDRGSSGVFFAAIEMGAAVMVRRSAIERGEVNRYRDDSLATDFTVQTDGTLKRSAVVANRFTNDLAHTRRLHVEDWVATIAFNHLLSSADAFVAAQLWDVPRVAVYPNGKDVWVVATVRW